MNILISLPTGIFVIIVVFMLLKKVFGLRTLVAGGSLALLVLLLVSGYSLFNWPGPDVFAIHLSLYLMTIYALSIVGKVRDEKGSGQQGGFHWGPASIIGFFAVVIITNTFFILLAQSDGSVSWMKWLVPEPRMGGDPKSVFPGTVSHDFRERENQYNEYQQQRDLQKQRGWTVTPGWKNKPLSGKESVLLLQVLDVSGNPIEDAKVSGQFLYPGDFRLDRAFDMNFTDNSKYSAKVLLPKPGNWNMVVTVRRQNDIHELRASTTVD